MVRTRLFGRNPEIAKSENGDLALCALSDFDIAAVCTTRQGSAEAAAQHFGIPLAYSNPEDLARDPDVVLVTVTVKVPDHYRSMMAAIDAPNNVCAKKPHISSRDRVRIEVDLPCRRRVGTAGNDPKRRRSGR
jgi:predicted dehydrogenase